VYDAILQDPSFFRFLQRIDEDFADSTRLSGCRHCAGRLHVADFPRKPRGCPASVAQEYSWRLSFTCGRCEQRATSVSVRFLGRRVYVAVVLMLASPEGGATARLLCARLSISIRTLQRWRRWWTEEFLRTPFWQTARSRFVPPMLITQLPASLLDRFDVPTLAERLAQVLRFISPLSVSYMVK
jgi:hypothetical protein